MTNTIDLKKTITTLTITILLTSTIAFIGIPMANAPLVYYAPTLETWGKGVAEWTTEKAYRGSYSVKITIPAGAGWEDMVAVKLPYGEALDTISLTTDGSNKVTGGDISYNYYSEGAYYPYPLLYLDKGGGDVVDMLLVGADVATHTLGGEWVDTFAPRYDDWGWCTYDPATGETGSLTFPTKTLADYQNDNPDATLVYVALGYGFAEGTIYVDDMVIPYLLEPQTVTTLGSYGKGVAEWTTAEKHRGSYSVKLVCPTDCDWTDAAFVEIPVDIVPEDFDPDQLSAWIKVTAGNWAPYFQLNSATKSVNTDMGAVTSPTVWFQHSASSTEQWQKDTGEWVSWAEAVTYFVDENITSVYVALSKDPTYGAITAYVDDIFGVPYPLECPVALDKPYYHTGETATVTVSDFYEAVNIHRADSVSVTVTSDVPDSVSLTLNESDVNTGVFTGTFNLVAESPGANDLLVIEGSIITVTYKGYTSPDTAEVDDTNPSVIIVSPLKNDNISDTTPTIKAEFTDAGGIDTAWLALDGPIREVVSGGDSISWVVPSIEPLGEGVHTAEVTVKDLAGNINVTTWAFTVDTVEPTCDISMNATSPVNATAIEFLFEFSQDMKTAPTIAGNATTYMDSVTAGWKDVRTYSANYTVKSEEFNGTVLLNATGALDMAENEMIPANFTFYIDTIAPTAPENLTAELLAHSIVLSWDASEDLGSGVELYNIYMNGTKVGSVDYPTTTFTDTDLEAGLFNYTVQAVDFAGNEANSTALEVEFEPEAVTEWDISLSEGWNLVSLPLIPENSSIEAVLSGVIANVSSVWAYDATSGDWLMYNPAVPEISDLTEMEDGVGYWINMTSAATLTIEGSEFPAPPATPPVYHVVVGWNLIGYKETVSMNASEYLAGVEYVRLWTFVNGRWTSVKATDQMVPGQGYWIAVSEEGSIYP